MKNLYFFLIVFSNIFLFSTIQGQEKSVTNLFKDLDEYIENAMNDWNVPGLAIGVVKDSNLVYAKGFGYRDLQNKLPVDENTLFGTASCTKAFSAVSFGLLVDKKQADLDKPIIEYLPSLKFYDNYLTQNITPRDVMCHRTGLSDNDYVNYGTGISREKLMSVLKYFEPELGFRESCLYNNTIFDLSGFMVSQISGKPWVEFTKESLLTPLGMEKTTFTFKEMQESDNYCLPYYYKDDSLIRVPYRETGVTNSSGSIISNIKEMGNWLIMNLNNGKFEGKQIISKSYLAQTHKVQIQVPYSSSELMTQYGYGLGWFVVSYRGNEMLYHDGGWDGFCSLVVMLPKNIGFVILANSTNVHILNVLFKTISDRLLEYESEDWHKNELEKFRKSQEISSTIKPDTLKILGTSPSHQLADYIGEYDNTAYGTIEIGLTNSGLLAERKPFKFYLNHYHYDVFEIDIIPQPFDLMDNELNGRKVQFHTNLKGQIKKLSMRFPYSGKKPIEFIKTDD
ncbi:MAG: serine hydrolase [Bacteroidetes bacterium]|jgi:CubicO group peptidase (beta-lactamase class C family)|nr:serine hydrolase [Bacteroidota bacterium]